MSRPQADQEVKLLASVLVKHPTRKGEEICVFPGDYLEIEELGPSNVRLATWIAGNKATFVVARSQVKLDPSLNAVLKPYAVENEARLLKAAVALLLSDGSLDVRALQGAVSAAAGLMSVGDLEKLETTYDNVNPRPV